MAVADQVLNQPVKVDLGPGCKFKVKEMSWGAARDNARRIHELVMKIRDANPGVNWDALSVDTMVEVIFNSFQHIIESAADLWEDIMVAATGEDRERFKDLPLGIFIQLSGEVLEAQKGAIEAFLSVRETAKGLGLAGGGNKTPQTEPQEQSSASQGQESAMSPS